MAVDLPTTWPELIDSNREYLSDTLGDVAESHALLDMAKARQLGAFLETPAEQLAEVAVTQGPETAVAQITALLPFLAKGDQDLGDGLHRDNKVSTLGLLCLTNVARACGTPVPQLRATDETTLIPQYEAHIEDLTEGERQTVAFAALALGRTDLIPALLDGGPLQRTFQAGQQFGPNAHGFTRYLATAVEQEVETPAIEPAWYSFVTAFPRKLAAGTLKWSDLLWAARALGEHFEGREAGDVANALHEYVQAL